MRRRPNLGTIAAMPHVTPAGSSASSSIPPTSPSSGAESPDSLAQLAARLQAFADARDWGRFHSPKNLASALVVEAGELLEPFQWLTEQQSRELPADVKDEVALEMADVLLYLVQLGNQLGVDVVEAAHRKIGINEGRFPSLKA